VDRDTDSGTPAAHGGGLAPPPLNLPKGGGAIRGIGEKFAAHPATGGGSVTVPIASSPGRSGFGPSLALGYDSGSGNGPFGFGWTLGLPAITRKTDKGIPRYADDDEEEDTFILSAAEDLVPALVEENGERRRHLEVRQAFGALYEIRRYRPRIEGLFARIERWVNPADRADSFWRSISRDNVTTWYGRTAESRICDPEDPRRIFSWLVCETHDDKGQVSSYGYKAEDSQDLDLGQLHERHRTAASRAASRYLKRIRYGNRTPYFPNLGAAPRTPLPQDWCFELVFDYGEHDADHPNPRLETRAWRVRLDPFSSYRAGFEIRTYRLCHRVLMFHHFPDEPEVGNDCLVRSTDFSHSVVADPASDRAPVYSFLLAATHAGYRRRDGGGYRRGALPSVEFTYSQAVIDDTIRDFDPESLRNLPSGVDEQLYRWIDLDGEGMPGILTDQAEHWYYQRNETPGDLNASDELPRARFGPLQALGAKPQPGTLGGTQRLLDLAGDGQLDLVDLESPTPGFHERTPQGGWTLHKPFESLPGIDWRNPHLRFIDLTGDGHADLLITEEDALCWHASLAESGFGPAQRAAKALDEETGPPAGFADTTQSLFLADLSGDGLTDIVRVRNGEVCYWPNLGYGRFGAKVSMDRAPWFEAPDLFDPRRIRLADVDGSGASDLLYLGSDGVRIYFNQSGNAWSPARHLRQFPAVNSVSSTTVVDVLGNGTACLVFSTPITADAQRSLRYLDLMGGQKPHLLISMRNNLGAETHIHYTPATRFYTQDRTAGTPWITRLPFPVHVVDRVETLDRISRNRFVTRYAYHHGYFDGREREFRGFGRVDQWDTQEIGALPGAGIDVAPSNEEAASYVPPVLTRTWFHTGAFLEGLGVSRQFESEYYRPPGLENDAAVLGFLPDTLLPAGLSLPEAHEACRALKGSMLRQEVYAVDGTPQSAHPYTVTEQDFTLRVVQARARNRHAVFFVHPRESISFQYERDPIGPRITHQFTLAVDAFGNVQRSATVAYGRHSEDPALSESDRLRQARMLATFNENSFTNAVDTPEAYRTPLPSATRTFELTGIALSGTAHWLSLEQIEAATTVAQPIPYESVPDGSLQRRLIAEARMFYRPDDLGTAAGDARALLPLGTVEAMALPGERHTLAFTPGLLAEVFGDRVDPTMLLEGGYLQGAADPGWWMPTGRAFLSANIDDPPAQELAVARQRFFIPQRFDDPFGNSARVAYDEHALLPIATADALANAVQVTNDYRVLQPRSVRDPNGNRSEVAFDALGQVVGAALMGKANETLGDSLEGFVADLDADAILAQLATPLADPQAILQGATTRLVYDLFAFQRTQDDVSPEAPVVCTLMRHTHLSDLAADQSTRIQLGFGYSDGFGREIQRKFQAEAGPVPQRDDVGGMVAGPDGQPLMTAEDASPRWVGTGWTVFNNKGGIVRQYEPFFSDTHRFEFDLRIGVSPMVFHDPLGRAVAVLQPNHAWEKVVFTPWRQIRWDVNDTVRLDDPSTDPDVGEYFRRLDPAEFLPSWQAQRVAGALGPREQAAAAKTATHADTPAVVHFDVLARPFLSRVHNRFLRDGTSIDELDATRLELDIQGRQRSVRDAIVQAGDARGRVVMRYDHDVPGNVIHSSSLDAGERWTLRDVAGKTIRAWDSRGHALRTEYDALRRPLRHHVRGHDPQDPAAELLYGRVDYGEDEPDAMARNLRARPVRVFDGAGVVASEAYDFKGNLLHGRRQMALEYRSYPDWAGTPALAPEVFETQTHYDALNRPVTIITPDGSVTRPEYNEAGLLGRLAVQLRGAQEATVFIANIDRDAKGKRTRVDYGHGVRTTYRYDGRTFRLTGLTTRRAGEVLQDLSYIYDPAGNITDLRDEAQQTIHYNGAVVDPHADYTYDALYRLIEASGREHIGQMTQPQSSWNDAGRTGHPHPHDGQAMRRYTERYRYDSSGNLLQLVHQATNGNWSRDYFYDEASPMEPPKRSNRLSRTRVGQGDELYAHDPHGNMTAMAHLASMQWTFTNQLRASARQVVEDGAPETTYYVYDAAGQRVRKVTERAAGNSEPPLRLRERLYLGGFELYREYGAAGDAVALERETLHVMDDQQRVAMVETRTRGEGNRSPLLRYQHGNHLGSSRLELDATGAVISYEEYHPYGSTAFQAGPIQAEVSLKRYRFSAKERDEESGLSLHGARYHATWLGRWTAADPAGHEHPEHSSYLFVAANPINFVDPDGRRFQLRVDHRARTVTFEAKVYTIDEQSFAEASEVAATLNHFSKTFDQGGVEYRVLFAIAVLAPPEPDILEAKLGTRLHWRAGRQNVKREKYRNAAQRWWISLLKSEAASNIYLGENTPIADMKKAILGRGQSMGLSQEDLRAVRDRLNGGSKQHAPTGIEVDVPAPATEKVSRGTTYLDMAIQMRPMKGGTPEATKHNIRLHEFLHLLGLADADTGESLMNYDFVGREDKRGGRARKLGPQDQDIEDLLNQAILRADPDPQNKAPINVIEPSNIEDWQNSFQRFRDWLWVQIP
jgi:RHS repeat-associated protein